MRRRTLRTGTTVVTVTFKNIKTAKSTAKKYRCVVKAALEQKPEEPATTAAKITAIKQASASKLEAEFSADVTGIKYSDLKIIRDETNTVVTVKSATVDAKDNTKVTIETYDSMTDGKTYTVTYTATDEAKTESTATFTATAGVVADIALNSYTVPANTPTEIKYQLLDANGVVIEEKGIGASAKSDKVEVSIENFNGYQNESEVTLYKTGDKATMKVVYHTWKYNNTDGTEEGKVEKSFEITAVDPSSVIETYEYSIAKNRADIDFKRDTLKKQIAIGDDDNATPKAFFSFCKANGTDITKNLDYTVSSGNENVLLANGTVAGGAELTPVAVGATYLVIKDASTGTLITTLPITVVAKRTLSTMSLDKSSVTVSAKSGTDGQQKITITVMDQYGDAYSAFTVDTPEKKTSADPGTMIPTAANPAAGKNTATITVNAGGNANAGSYAYTVDLKDSVTTTNVKKVSFNVVVVNKIDAVNDSHALVMRNAVTGDVVSKVDTTVGGDTYTGTKLVPTIVIKNNGVITKNADDITSIGAITLTKGGAKVDNPSNSIYGTTTAGDVSTAYVKVSENSGGNATTDVIKKNLEPGVYTVSFEAKITGIAKPQSMSTSFTVEDSQKVFEADVKKTTISSTDATTLEDMFNNPDCVKFSYASNEIEKNGVNGYTYNYASAKQTRVNDNTINVEKVTMNVLLPGTNGKWVQMTASVGRTFKFTTLAASAGNTSSKMKTFANTYTTNGTLKTAYQTTAAAIKVLDDAKTISDNYAQLTAAEQTALNDDYVKTTAVAKEAAAVVLKGAASVSSTEITKAYAVFGFGAPSAEEVTIVQGSTTTFPNVTSATAITAINSVKTAIAQAVTDAGINATAIKDALDDFETEAAITGVNVLNVGTLASAGSATLTVVPTVSGTASAAGAITDIGVIYDSSASTIKLVVTGTAAQAASGSSVTIKTGTITITQTVQFDGASTTVTRTSDVDNANLVCTYYNDGADVDTWKVQKN